MSVGIPQPPPPVELQAEVDADKEKIEDVGEPVGKLCLGQSIT